MPNILNIDLGNKKKSITKLGLTYKECRLGGRGLGTYLYAKNPLKATDPENAVYLVPGLFTGTLLPSSSRIEVVTSSPLTSHLTASSAGGYFGAFLKHNNIDAINISGRSEEWCYVVIQDGKAEVKSASELVGKDVFETQKILKSEYPDSSISIATIGQAGENLIKFATLMFDSRAAGRTGTGWHFGFKKIKAIVVVDSKLQQPAKYPDKMKDILREALEKKIIQDRETATYCTPSFTEWSNDIQTYPASNYRRNFVTKEEIAELGLEKYKQTLIRKAACWNCPIACTRIVLNKNGDEIRGPEYESVWSLGASCDNFDMLNVNECNYLCNKYGMDTLTTGSVLAWYKECIDKGLIDQKWSGDSMLELIKKIAYRDDIGSTLAEGSLKSSEILGFGKEFIAHSKGLELPAWDPRVAIGMALSYATASTGGDHCKGWTVAQNTADKDNQFSPLGKAQEVVEHQNDSALLDSMGTCMFADFMYNADVWSKAIYAYTGEQIDPTELTGIGQDIIETEHEINLNLGHNISENSLPERIIGYEIEVNGKKTALTQDIFDKMISDYNDIRGWK